MSAPLVIVTGATRGVGLGIVHCLIDDGCRVAAVARTPSPAIADLSTRADITFFPFDLGDVSGIDELVRTICSRCGSEIFALVNNAALGLDGLLASATLAEMDAAIRVNLISPMVLTQRVVRKMIARWIGRVVSVSSVSASIGVEGLSVYSASKAGLEGFTRALAKELGPVGITVNAVAPRSVQTHMTALREDQIERIPKQSPLGLATPEDVASSVAFLLSRGARRVTGSHVDGGRRCHHMSEPV